MHQSTVGATAAEGEVVTLDVREMPLWERHPEIFDLFDSLQPGDAIELINDHEPRLLHYQFNKERKEQFEWSSHEEEPRKWVALIKRV